MIDVLPFYAFAVPLVFSAVMTVSSRNPVHAVLFMAAAFASGAGVLVTLDATFLAFIVLIVSLGAVAVLFLFVVMMLGGLATQDASRKRSKEKRAVLVVCGLLFAQILAALLAVAHKNESAVFQSRDDAEVLGHSLYTSFGLPFQVAGCILLVAIVGAIVLVLEPRRAAKKQNALEQTLTDPKKVVVLKDIPFKTGVS